MSHKNIEKLIVNYESRLQKLKEQLALFGFDAPPHISVEIEHIEAEIEKLQTKLKAIDDSVVNDTNSEQLVRIQLTGDFPSLTAERQATIIAVLAGLLNIPREAIEVLGAHGGSMVFYLGMPSDAVQRLRSLLQSNNAQLGLLEIEKVILENESGEIEEWVIKEEIPHLVTSTYTTISSGTSGKPQRTRYVIGALIEQYGWTLLSEEELVALVRNSGQAQMTRAKVERLVKRYYTIALYEACQQRQDPSRREQGYRELYRILLRVAYRRWPELAEDVTQRALILVYEQFDRCRTSVTFLAFALNKLRHAYQQEARARGRELSETEIKWDSLDAGQSSTETRLEQDELLRVLVEAIRNLPDPRQRQIIILTFFKGLNDEAIGVQVGCTANHARVLRHRALKRLRGDDSLRAYLGGI